MQPQDNKQADLNNQPNMHWTEGSSLWAILNSTEEPDRAIVEARKKLKDILADCHSELMDHVGNEIDVDYDPETGSTRYISGPMYHLHEELFGNPCEVCIEEQKEADKQYGELMP